MKTYSIVTNVTPLHHNQLPAAQVFDLIPGMCADTQ